MAKQGTPIEAEAETEVKEKSSAGCARPYKVDDAAVWAFLAGMVLFLGIVVNIVAAVWEHIRR